MSEPFTAHWIADTLRCVIVAGAILLDVLIARLWWVQQQRGPRLRGVHPAIVVSYMGCVLLIAMQRAQYIGDPLNWWLILGVALLALGYYGLHERIRLTRQPPWNRPPVAPEQQPPRTGDSRPDHEGRSGGRRGEAPNHGQP